MSSALQQRVEDIMSNAPVGSWNGAEDESRFLLTYFEREELTMLEDYLYIRGISKRTFTRWVNEHPDFAEAWERAQVARTAANAAVYRSVIEQRPGYALYDAQRLGDFMKAQHEEFNPTSKIDQNLNANVTVNLGETFAMLMAETSAAGSSLVSGAGQPMSVMQALRLQQEINYRKRYSVEHTVETILASVGINPHEVPAMALPAHAAEEFTEDERAFLATQNIVSNAHEWSAEDVDMMIELDPEGDDDAV